MLLLLVVHRDELHLLVALIGPATTPQLVSTQALTSLEPFAPRLQRYPAIGQIDQFIRQRCRRSVDVFVATPTHLNVTVARQRRSHRYPVMRQPPLHRGKNRARPRSPQPASAPPFRRRLV